MTGIVKVLRRLGPTILCRGLNAARTCDTVFTAAARNLITCLG